MDTTFGLTDCDQPSFVETMDPYDRHTHAKVVAFSIEGRGNEAMHGQVEIDPNHQFITSMALKILSISLNSSGVTLTIPMDQGHFEYVGEGLRGPVYSFRGNNPAMLPLEYILT